MGLLAPRANHAVKRREWLQVDRLRLQHERIMSARLAAEFRRVARASAKAYAASQEVGVDLEMDAHEDKLRRIMAVDIRRTFTTFGNRVRSQGKSFGILETKDTPSEFSQAQADYLEEVGGEKIVNIAQTTKRAIGSVIAAGVLEGENLAQIQKRIRAVGEGQVGFLRSAVISRTEVHSAQAAAEDAMVKALGVSSQVKREWLDANDDRVRNTHRTELWDPESRIKAEDEPFIVGGASLDYPGDPKGPAKEIIMCRCSLGYITPDPTPEKPREQPGFESGKFRPSDFNKAFDDPAVDGNALLRTTMTREQAVEMKQIEKQLKELQPTDKRFRINGEWTEERAALHEEIIQKFLSKDAIAAATPAAGEAPTVTFFGGRGGSGKGWFTRSAEKGGAGNTVVDKTKNIVMDADKIKEELFAADGVDGRLAGLYHEESASIFDRIVEKAREKRLNIVLDKTLKTTSSAIKDAETFAKVGYDVDGFYMYLPRQEAGKRAILRTFGEQRRYVPVDIVLKNTTNEESFEALLPYFRRWRFYDNQVPKGASPRLVSGNF